MKKIISIITVLTGLIFVFTGCEEERDNPVLDITQIEAPVIQGPSGGDFVLLQEELENVAFTIEWAPADYLMDSALIDPVYAVEFDEVGDNFDAPATFSTTSETSVSITVEQLNNICGVLGLPVETASQIEMRIRSFYTSASEDLTVTSDPVSMNVTPFEFKVPPIYILGDGTIPGWDNSAALEMENVEDATYAIVTTLGESGPFMKFISVLGQWAPQWGGEGEQTVADGGVSGNLAYRPTEAVADPPAIPVPETAGEYRVVADTTGLTYSATPTSSKVAVIGDGVSSGWNVGGAIDMEKLAPGKFSIVLEHDGTEGKAIQFIGDQNTIMGSSYPFKTSNSKLVETFAGRQSGSLVYLPSKQGTFEIQVNLATNEFLIIEK